MSATPISKKLTLLGTGLSHTIQRAGSVISSSLRSCDDASDILLAGNTEFVVKTKNVKAESLATHLGSLTRETFKPRIWGDHKFQFSVNWVQNTTDSGGSIVIKCWNVKLADIPFTVSWQRKYLGVNFTIPDYNAP